MALESLAATVTPYALASMSAVACAVVSSALSSTRSGSSALRT